MRVDAGPGRLGGAGPPCRTRDARLRRGCAADGVGRRAGGRGERIHGGGEDDLHLSAGQAGRAEGRGRGGGGREPALRARRRPLRLLARLAAARRRGRGAGGDPASRRRARGDAHRPVQVADRVRAVQGARQPCVPLGAARARLKGDAAGGSGARDLPRRRRASHVGLHAALHLARHRLAPPPLPLRRHRHRRLPPPRAAPPPHHPPDAPRPAALRRWVGGISVRR
mmetsp:Transcript_3698/g.12283  ORF Transcript_3698/g.12283 Transcript_3698/m.12283 type:complete len:226 (-) Transcript_3698:372-1049(-)